MTSKNLLKALKDGAFIYNNDRRFPWRLSTNNAAIRDSMIYKLTMEKKIKHENGDKIVIAND